MTLIMNGIFVALSWCAALVFAGEPASCGEQPKCESARRALIAAESAVEEAIAKRALWTTARSALALGAALFGVLVFRSVESVALAALIALASATTPLLWSHSRAATGDGCAAGGMTSHAGFFSTKLKYFISPFAKAR